MSGKKKVIYEDYSLLLKNLHYALYTGKKEGSDEINPYTDNGDCIFALRISYNKKNQEHLLRSVSKKESPAFAGKDNWKEIKGVYSHNGRAKNTCFRKFFFLAHLGGWRTGLTDISQDIIDAIFNGDTAKYGKNIQKELHDEIIRWEYSIENNEASFSLREEAKEGAKNISEFICQRNYELIRGFATDRKVLARVLNKFIDNNNVHEENAIDNQDRGKEENLQSASPNLKNDDTLDGFSLLIIDLNKIMTAYDCLPDSETEQKDHLLARVLSWLVIGSVLGRDFLDKVIIDRGLAPYLPEDDQTVVAEKHDKPIITECGIAEELQIENSQISNIITPPDSTDIIIDSMKPKRFTNKNLVTPFTREDSNAAQGGTYVQRDDLLGKIEACFESQKRKKRMVFLTGMGGSGKSELARAYAYTHNEDYEEIFWLTCTDGVKPELWDIIEKAEKQDEVTKKDVYNFSNKVLIIVDNCNSEDGRFLFDLEKQTGEADILVTTRLSRIGNYESLVFVESEAPEEFSYSVFEKNYCKKPRWGKTREIRENEKDSIHSICREVQYNTMLVSLIAIRLRTYNDLSIHDCAEKIRNGVSKLDGKVIIGKDLENRSEEIREILYDLFSDILSYQFTDAEKAILTVLSLTPASWYDVDYIISLCRGVQRDTRYEEAVWTLLDLGWVQGDGVSMALHPLIADVLSSKLIVVRESPFFERMVNNYLGMPDEYLGKERLLIDKILSLAETLPPKNKLATMIIINHGGYKEIFNEIYPEVNAAYFVYVIHKGERRFYYHDMEKEDTCLLTDVPCQIYEGKKIELLKVYNNAVSCTLNLQLDIFGKVIDEVPDRISFKNSFLTGCLLPEGMKTIGDSAFFYCSGFSSELHLPESLTSIGDRAFSGCSRFSGELHLPENLTSIGGWAFSGCSGFSGELHLPESLMSIGERAFSGCSGFSGELHLPESLMSIGERAFSGCSGFSGELHLPESLTSIGDDAFEGCRGFSGELHFPEGLTSIGKEAFSGCSGFSGKLHLPEGLTNIGALAFYGCSGLSGELYLPEGLTSIGGWTFNGCSGLSGELHLPESLTSIGLGAFSGCGGFSGELHLPESLASIERIAFSGCSGFSGELHLPEGLTSIGEGAFSGCSGFSGELHLPEGLTSIGEGAFSGCSGFSGELHLPESLTSIGDDAFEGCSGFSGELHFPEGLTSIGKGAFSGCSGFSGELHLPESLMSIGERAFSGCSGFSGELNLPESQTSIGEGAFSGCSGLSWELHLPESLASIGGTVFDGSKNLNADNIKWLTSEMLKCIKEGKSYGCSYPSRESHMPEGLTNIGALAFYGCSLLSGELHLPKSLTSIGEWAFYGCSGLSGELHLPEGLTNIGDLAFLGCSGLSGELHLPESLTSIGKGAFYGCSGFSGELHLPENLTSIELGAFFGCSGFSGEIHLPEGLTNIGVLAFYGCSGLSGELHLPESLTSIELGAFYGCSGFSGELHLPESLTSIELGAFYGCSGFSGEIHFSESLTSIGKGAFYGCSGLSGELHLPEGLMNIGDLAFSGCSGLSGELHLPESLTSIGKWAFSGCNGLSGELHFPEGLTSIGDYAFEECDGFIGELYLPESLTSIGQSAFSGCNSLSGELHFPDGLTSIGYYAFKGCSGFSGKLHLPESLTRIESGAFSGCSGFSDELHLPESLTSIGGWAFYDCSGFSGELKLPKGLTSIGDYAFEGCIGLYGVFYLPESLERIGNRALNGCDAIEKIIFYNPNTEIEGSLSLYSSPVICGYRNSTAEKYANKHGLIFEEM